MDGYGVFKELNSQYEGLFKEDLKHGRGKEVFNTGVVYIGDFANNKFDGNGELIWPNKNNYKGKFKNGFRHGKGEYHTQRGDHFKGSFLNDKKSGFGTFLWKTGN